jgi:hypothetical protein
MLCMTWVGSTAGTCRQASVCESNASSRLSSFRFSKADIARLNGAVTTSVPFSAKAVFGRGRCRPSLSQGLTASYKLSFILAASHAENTGYPDFRGCFTLTYRTALVLFAPIRLKMTAGDWGRSRLFASRQSVAFLRHLITGRGSGQC